MDWNPRPLESGNVTVHRRGRGQPLVLLHCLGQSWRFWDVLEPLTDRYELIAYSLPGHADTPLPAGQYDQEATTRQLKELAEREGLTRFHLAGISMGGSLAQHFAGTHPDMVEKLILCDCTPRYNEESRANWPVRAKIAREQGVTALIPMLLGVFFTPGSVAGNGPNVRHVVETFEACSGEGYALACEWLAMVDAREQAKRIEAPTLIMLGSEEREAFKEAAAWMQANIPGSRGIVEVPAAGHASVRERPEFCVAQFRDFLG
ncbi:alpha/beta fold hydrolase [Paracraurococcus lichenis]|uniref:Alpha/beta fold hydrolase n=1 Tax=Paracraurococcus lichenis TaxID=3064888 RepID=A0ABT9DSP4_9PROT|nr:alpha/beta fold hydrolase [Paracraurococcus sp. LOR1-02]MDO9706917.1 alpha/beta fold hydrolase [Paracraurococcus sp. LOR1-02]